MGKPIGVLIIHGVGIQKRNYSERIKRGVVRELRKQGCDSTQVVFQEVLYTCIFDDQQKVRSNYLINTSVWYQFLTRIVRWSLIHILSDAVSYRGQYKRVHEIISDNINELQAKLVKNRPIVVVAHSMGVMAISDYIYDQQNDKCPEMQLEKINNLKALVTFGCNIPLFEMGHKETVCIKRPKSDDQEKEFFWCNFYSPFDVLGYRIEKYYTIKPEPTFKIEDKLIFAGGIFSKWNTACHMGYWAHPNIHACVSNIITKIL